MKTIEIGTIEIEMEETMREQKGLFRVKTITDREIDLQEGFKIIGGRGSMNGADQGPEVHTIDKDDVRMNVLMIGQTNEVRTEVHLTGTIGAMKDIMIIDEMIWSGDSKELVEVHLMTDGHRLKKENPINWTKNPARKARDRRTKRIKNTRKRSRAKNIRNIHQVTVAVTATVVQAQVHLKLFHY